MEKRILYSEKSRAHLPSGFGFPHTAVASPDIARSVRETRAPGSNSSLTVIILTAEEFARMGSISEQRLSDSMYFKAIITGAGIEDSLADSPLLGTWPI